MLKRNLFLLVATLAFGVGQVACGGSSLDENLRVRNVEPVGSVGGQVLDASDDRPLAGASVRVVSGDFSGTATTDGSGLWSVSEVPASGSVIVIIEAPGMLPARTSATFTPAAGDYPMSNATLTIGPVGLLPASGTFSVWVFDENGKPAAGYNLALTTSLGWLLYESGNPLGRGELTVSATVEANGLARFTGLPDYWLMGSKINDYVIISVPPYDADGDGYLEYPGDELYWNLLELDNPQPTILLRSDAHYPSTLSILASNIADLEEWSSTSFVPDTIDPVGPIHVLFNTPVSQDSLAIEVWSEDGTTSFGSSFTLVGRSLTIQFPTALPTDTDITGAEYNLLISAVAETGDRLIYGSFNAAFFVLDSNNTEGVSVTVEKEDPSDPTNQWARLTFSEPVGFGSPGTALSGSNCVLYFGIDVGPNAGTGNDPGEWGYDGCPYVLYPDEPSPVHPAGAGLSGYTTTWHFVLPTTGGGANMPAGIPLYLAFDQVASTSRIMRRANGEPVPMKELTTP